MNISKNAKWIWDTQNCLNQYVIFKKNFVLETLEKKYMFSISVHGEYVLFINGKFVQFNQYHSFPEKKAFDEFEISGEIFKQGTNLIEITVYNQNASSAQYIKHDGMLIFTLSGRYTETVSDETVLCCAEPHYKNGIMPRITPQLGFTYEYDARKDNYIFHNAKVLNTKTMLYPRPSEKLEILPPVHGTVIKKGSFSYPYIFESTADKIQRAEMYENISGSDGEYIIFALDTEYAGLFYMDISAEEGTVIDISYGEHITDGRVRAKIGPRNFANTYTAKSGRQQFIHYFSRMAARYIQLNISGKCTVYSAGIIPTDYPLPNVQVPNSLSKIHKKIYETAVQTLKLCMHEHYEDCPWREQALYSMDSRTEALCGYYLWQNYDFSKACIDLLGESLKPCGFLELNAPANLEFTIPSFSFMWIVEVYEYLTYSSRKKEAENYSQTINTIFERVLNDTENGFIKTPCGKQYWNYYEWSDGLSGCIGSDTDGLGRYDAPYQLFFLMALQKGIEILKYADYNISKYEIQIKKLKKQIRQLFFDDEKKLYCTYNEKGQRYHYCELVQSLAVICEVDSDSKHIRSVLADKNSNLTKISLSHLIFKYDALLSDAAYSEYVMKNIEDIWGGMIEKGAVTFWEVEEGESSFDNAGSLCHGWSSLPVYIYHKYILSK